MSAVPSNFAGVARCAWPGWDNVEVYRNHRGDLVVALSVSERHWEAEARGQGPGALIDKLMQGASVQQLVRKVLAHQQRSGLKRYAKKSRRRLRFATSKELR